jgi:hypothetical protein
VAASSARGWHVCCDIGFVAPAQSYEMQRSSPTPRASTTKTELRLVAEELVSDYLLGKLGEVDETFGPIARTLLLERLLARCPGFSTRDYRSALTAMLPGRNRGQLAATRR